MTVDYEGTEVACETVEISANGEVSLADCKVNKKSVDNTYGDVEEDDKTDEGNEGESGSTQVYKPQYYSWAPTGKIGTTFSYEATENASELGKSFYIGFDVDSNNKVTAAYVCFTLMNQEYCLKGKDTNAYATNNAILIDALGESGCLIDGGYTYCDRGVDVVSNGSVNIWDDRYTCLISSTGSFYCDYR